MKQKTIKVVYTSRQSQRRSYYGGNSYSFLPKIQMEGRWLEALGFNIGDRLSVSYDEQGIHITHAPEPEPVMMVAEPSAEYGNGRRGKGGKK